MAKTAIVHKPNTAPNFFNSNYSFKIANKTYTFTPEEKICTLLLVILIFLVYTIRSKFLLIPFERDEGIYCYSGKLVLEGKIPYKDFYEMKFPGIFYFYATIIALFGDTVKGAHQGFLWVNILSIFFIYLASKKMFSPIAGIISATTMAIVSLTPNLSGFTVQSEHGVALFISLGLLFYAYARDNKHILLYSFSGMSMAMAVMIKTLGIFLAGWGGLIIILDFLFTKEKAYNNFFKNIFAYALGGIITVALFIIIVIIKGGFKEMIYWTFDVSKYYSQLMTFEEGSKYFRYTRDAILQNHKFFWYHAFFALAVCLIPSISYKLKAFGITLLLCSCLTIVPGYFFYGHYWIQIIPGLALVAGLTYHCITTVFESKIKLGKLKLRYIYLSLFALFTISHINALKTYYFHPNYELVLRQTYGNNPFPEDMEIANFINANSKPEDNIVLIGSEPQIYFYTKKKSPSRHAYFTALVINVPMHKEWQREFVRDTEKAKPRYIVFFNHQLSLMVQPNTDKYVFEWANKYIAENYKVVGVVEMADGQLSNYVWKEAALNYQPKTPSYVLVFERKTP